MTIVSVPLFAALNSFSVEGDILSLYGWVAHPRQALTQISMYLNSVPIVEKYELLDREDVQRELFRFNPLAVRSGFAITVTLSPRISIQSINTLTLVGFDNDQEVGKTALVVRDFVRLPGRFPVPPPDLQVHVGQQEPDFLERGWRIYSDLKTQLEKFRELNQFVRVLDWGCGCGRVTRYFMEDMPATRIFGCDIDAEAIDWDTQNLNPWTFSQIQAVPPTPYPNNYFDLIYGISIFTHFDEKTQFQWLAELHRIVRADGIIAVSILDRTQVPFQLEAILCQNGFVDLPGDDRALFEPYADAEYYRLTYHTHEYISEQWSRFFDILAYSEMAINSQQSLVLLRPKLLT